MASKVKWDRNAWWVVTHYQGKRKRNRIGSAKADKVRAEKIAEKINASLALGIFDPQTEKPIPIPFDVHLLDWHLKYSPTFKHSYEITSKGVVETHLVPFFGSKDLRDITEDDLLDYIRLKIDAGLAPRTIETALSIVRRVLGLAQRKGTIDRNPAERIGELMRRVERRAATEVQTIDAWTPEEIQNLLSAAAEHEPRFYPALLTLMSTGMRRGELLGLKWTDVDFNQSRIAVRRALVRGQLTTPKNGKGRQIAMSPGLGSTLLDLLGTRRRESLHESWSEIPEWVFCSRTGGQLDERNFTRTWDRVRRRAQKLGVRPLKLHCTRHTYASTALAAGKSLRWVADQLGHKTQSSHSEPTPTRSARRKLIWVS
jgi:integrase